MAILQQKIVLCVPQGGLVDVFTQIDRCWEYAERYQRQLIVDTSRRKLVGAVFELLVAKDPTANVELKLPDSFSAQVKSMSILPRGFSLTESVRQIEGKLVWGENDEAVTFDFSEDHPEDLLVHWQSGGGRYRALSRFQLAGHNVELIKKHLLDLPPDYDSLHVRNTDYKTDYFEPLVHLASRRTDVPLVVCSDSNVVLDSARKIVSQRPVMTFPNHPIDLGRPLHRDFDDYPGSSDPVMRTSAHRLFAEILTLTGARTFYLCPVTKAYPNGTPRFSGFSRMLEFLVTHPDVRQAFFGTELVRSGDKHLGAVQRMMVPVQG